MDTLKANSQAHTVFKTCELKSKLVSMAGFTMLELMVVLAMMGAISGMAAYQLKQLDNPAENSAAQVMSFIKKTRAKALATTYAYRVRPKANGLELETHYAISCTSTTFTADTSLALKLPRTAAFNSNAWSLCFAPRGTLATSQDISITDSKRTVTVQVAMGGGMRKI
jgi:prepilin-type N-terminal cleavage/methylation domain-containing protein